MQSHSFLLSNLLLTSKLDALSQTIKKQQPRLLFLILIFFAEREGFEPPVPLSTTVFKTAAIDHSAISPKEWCKDSAIFLIWK